ncbi:MAG: nucleoside recognition protein [Campylobacterota bacterium]
MQFKHSFYASINSALIIVKLVIPIYILAEILYHYNTLEYIAFLIEPVTSLLNLPAQSALAIISGMFLNLYAAVAFAAPLEMSIHQWSILAVFLGICHSLVVESAIMKKLGISNSYSYALRIVVGLLAGIFTALLPSELFNATVSAHTFEKQDHSSIIDLLSTATYAAVILAVKIIILITALIFIMDFIKSLPQLQRGQKHVSKGFSITVGVILGITYGAGILIKEAQSGAMSKKEIFTIATFLMICHAIIEDTLLFVIFGADFTMVVAIRTFFAIIVAWLMLWLFYHRRQTL